MAQISAEGESVILCLLSPVPSLNQIHSSAQTVTPLSLWHFSCISHTRFIHLSTHQWTTFHQTPLHKEPLFCYCEMHSELNNKAAKVTSTVTNTGTLMIWNLFIVYWNKHKQAGMRTCVHIWTHGRVCFSESPSVWVGVYRGCLWVTNTSFACELSNVQLCKRAKKTFPVSLCYLLISQFWI